MTESYRRQFQETARAGEYETREYAPTSYSELLWRIEREQLRRVIDELRQTHSSIDYLDFAAGTGRIIRFVEGSVDTATGIEISESMAALARQKLGKARMICTDILAPGAAVEGKYDLITAFRFFLNAEPSLRQGGMKALASRLKDRDSRLVFNNHGNLWSHKLLLWPLHALRNRGKAYRPEGNYLTDAQVRRLTSGAGLVIEKVMSAGILSAKLLRAVSFERALRLEQRLATVPGLRRIAVNQMYVARLQ